MSRVYAANIAGSVAGSLLVNFGVLQFATTQLAFALFGLLSAALGVAIVAYAAPTRALRLGAATCALIASASLAGSFGPRNWLIESLLIRRHSPCHPAQSGARARVCAAGKVSTGLPGGKAVPEQVSAKMANTLASSNRLHRTYAPAQLAPVRNVDAARRRGRRVLRGQKADAPEERKLDESVPAAGPKVAR